MRKSRIVLLGLFLTLSFAVFKAMGDDGSQRSVIQTAVVKDSFSKTELAWSPVIITETVPSPEVTAQGMLMTTASSSALNSEHSCGSGVRAREGLMGYLNSDITLFNRKTDGRWPIASITKLMTAIVATEAGMLERTITMTEDMVATEGDAGNFKVGELVSGSDLLESMLLVSSNDAAEAFAQSYGRDAFIRLMNEKAQKLRMFNTHYVDPSGLSPMNQSTPNDLYALAGHLYEIHPAILGISRMNKTTVVDLKTNRKRTLSTINEFAAQRLVGGSARIAFVGGKTGYIEEAEGNGNLFSIFTHDGQPFVIVVLGSPDRFGETKLLLTCI